VKAELNKMLKSSYGSLHVAGKNCPICSTPMKSTPDPYADEGTQIPLTGWWCPNCKQYRFSALSPEQRIADLKDFFQDQVMDPLANPPQFMDRCPGCGKDIPPGMMQCPLCHAPLTNAASKTAVGVAICRNCGKPIIEPDNGGWRHEETESSECEGVPEGSWSDRAEPEP
jgi:uncharacterized protein with PIN domain